jgi:hypothetical protein
MKKFFLLLLLLLLLPSGIAAKYDPRTVPNNKFGIHVADPNDVGETSLLLNTSGGDWGYVTLVIQENNRDFDTWQGVFDRMRRAHLIPIVRLATKVENAAWTKPTDASAGDWAQFLNQLNWPTENRYVAVFNEPNHAKEWGDTIDPALYAHTLSVFARVLHDASEDFFILAAGMDVSARSDALSLDAAEYWRRMQEAVPEIFTLIDGWNSHSYPNPGFSGSPYASGRGTLRSYAWELAYLSGMGLDPDLPVFITETGWMHEGGKIPNPGLLSDGEVGVNLERAAAGAWADPRVVAVTPFVYSYQDIPFDHFSWKRLGTGEFYTQYAAYQQVTKVKGLPQQRHEFRFDEPLIPDELVAGSTYTLEATVVNSGQSILTPNEFQATLISDQTNFQVIFDPLPTLEPGQTGTVRMHLATPSNPGTYNARIVFLHHGREIPVSEATLTLIPPPAVVIRAQLGWRRTSHTEDVTLLVYDMKDNLLHKFPGLRIEDGRVRAEGLTNIIPGKFYRIVVLAPYYLPRQEITTLNAQETALTMKRFLPLDFNDDGAFTFADIQALLTSQPKGVIPRFFTP